MKSPESSSQKIQQEWFKPDEMSVQDASLLTKNNEIQKTVENHTVISQLNPENYKPIDLADQSSVSGLDAAISKTASWMKFEFLKPYFKVTEKEVLRNVIGTLSIASMKERIRDLYGPLMSSLTLIFLLTTLMKSAMNINMTSTTDSSWRNGQFKQEGTFLGKAYFLTMFYWLGTSAASYAICFVFEIPYFTLPKLMSLIGYHIFPINLMVLLKMISTNMFPNSPSWIWIIIYFAVGVISMLNIARTVLDATIMVSASTTATMNDNKKTPVMSIILILWICIAYSIFAMVCLNQ